jgi:signal transduction histidine kinase/iron only hydrogenase large subunit-like protein
VRECPVKAIKIINGQAEVLEERCIACGNCTRVCSQGAKVFLDTTSNMMRLLQSKQDVVAILAPSFVAEYPELDAPGKLVGALHQLGFARVYEVAFGADLVAAEYRKLILKNGEKGYISSDCPSIVGYIEKYVPELVDRLAPVVSPMVAMTRYLRLKHGDGFRIVFIGPCVAKKWENNEVDEHITFTELRELMLRLGIDPAVSEPADFHPPLGGKGAIFPISRGLLNSVNLPEEILEKKVVVAEGRVDFQEAIKEYLSGAIENTHLELLCCEGCIMGPGTSRNGKKYARRTRVMDYVYHKLENFNRDAWEIAMEEGESLDLSRSFRKNLQTLGDPSEGEVAEILRSMNKTSEKDQLNCGACGYDTCRNHAVAICKGLAETEMCLPYTIEKLHQSVEDLAESNEKLMSVKQVLKQTEKLAHMGQLSAGIAHELNNPLGVVIMYSNILLEEAGDNETLKEDLHLITEQAQRCKAIVGGLLNFARKNQVNYTEVELDELVRISLSSIVIPGNVKVSVINELRGGTAEMDQEQMVQVVTNLIKNAIEAMPLGGSIDVYLSGTEQSINIEIRDNGTGINETDLQKVFEPFFTTKGIGKGTGLGLATAYGVVKMHKGKITVDSNANPSNGPTYTRFTIELPRRRSK